MAYITNYNCKKIATRNNFKNIKIDGEIYKTLILFFSLYEENCLLAIQEILKSPENFFKTIYNPIVAIDTKKYIYKEKQPAYHTSINCEMLNSDYSNFDLPIEIIERGDAEIEKFRDWFKQNSHLLETPDIFVMRLQLAFNITYNPQAINYENSGHTDFKNYTVQELEKKIDQLLTDSGRFYSESLKNKTVLKMFWKCSSDIIKGATFKNSTSYKNYEVKNIVKEFHTKYKSPVYHLLINYYRIKFNPDLQFAEDTLQSLGFKKCYNCIKEDKAAKEKFNRDLYNFDNLIKNPELLKKLDLIDKLVDNSK